MRDKFFYIVVCFLFFQTVYGQRASTPFSLLEINQRITDSLSLKQEALNWADMDLDLLWSTIVRTDSMVIIGFKPSNFLNSREAINSNEFTNTDWTGARKNLLSWIRTETARTGINLSDQELFGSSNKQARSYIHAKVFSKSMISSLRTNPDIRYVEPANYAYEPSLNRSGEGCSDYSVIIDAADYTSISPAAISSWTNDEHDIDLAWDKSNKGSGVWIAVMDSGISSANPKFNAEFDQGDSAGRVIEKKGFYSPNNNGITDGTDDLCGHGTAMAGLATGTRGFDGTPVGVSYQANLITYRVTNDVIINATAEIDGLHDALMDAGNDSRIDIISISLGDVFTHGPVEDGIIFAHDQDKLIFAAAGTSTSFTNFVGVIAPANMPEAVAVTGVVEGTTFQKCNNCHSGSEVEFAVYMERSASGNTAVTNTNDNVSNNDYRGYVGGSSSSTAIMSGIAGLVFSNNPNDSKDQVLNKLIQASSEFPNKDSDYGWGTVDVCAAVDTTQNLPCNSSVGNSVSLEIHTISFPPVGDGLGDPELVVIIENQSYYFNVPTSGATSNPNTYAADISGCDDVPIIVDLGTHTCGVSTFNISVETHEDDSFSSNCNFNFGDDLQLMTTQTVSFNNTSFTHGNTSTGNFVFTYSLVCTPTLLAEVSSTQPVCNGESITFTASPTGETNYNFFLDSNNNDLLDAGESLQNGSTESYASNTLAQNDILGIEITDANGCTSYDFVTIEFTNFTGTNALVGIETGIADYETNDAIESTQTIDATAVVDYDAVTQICLDAGFEVVKGAVFSAFLDGCNGGLGGENLGINQENNK